MTSTALRLPVALALVVCCTGCDRELRVGEADDAPPDPLVATCSELGIEGDCNGVVILSQAAHLDWDWQNRFQTYVDGSCPDGSSPVCCDYGAPPFSHYCQPECSTTNSILADAAGLLAADNRYRYSACEIGFLRAFAQDKATQFDDMKAQPGLRIVGGGITSADNLLPHGEAFIRNYLVGKSWMDGQSLGWTGQIWLPDNFGHDSQLPVVLQAMGATGVGFSRIPGACNQNVPPALERSQLAAARLLGQDGGDPGGVTFRWQANDGSQVLAHWLQDHYMQGAFLATPVAQIPSGLFDTPESQALCDDSERQKYDSEGQIQAFIGDNGPVSPTPFVYVHVSADFMVPIDGGETPQLLTIADDWNRSDDRTEGYAAMVGTFDDYVRLVDQYVEQQKAAGVDVLETRNFHGSDDQSFQPTPYWMGFYASRPALKALHAEATRTLLAAETFAALPRYAVVGGADVPLPRPLLDIWDDLAPSTHHDYITGTSPDCVYTGEQLPLLQQALSEGRQALGTALSQIAAQVPVAENQPSVVAFNPLGFDRQGIVEVTAGAAALSTLGGLSQTQLTDDGTLLACATAPSLGYRMSALGASGCTDLGGLDLQLLPDAGEPQEIVLGNRYLQATISKAANWSITSLVDLATGAEVFADDANTLTFYDDDGGLYLFGYECGGTFAPSATRVSPDPDVEVDGKSGDLRLRVTATVSYQGNEITKEYVLLAGEPMLRMTITGAVPERTTAMVRFPFAEPLATMIHGTPYHWDYKAPLTVAEGGFGATFEATHDFVAVQDTNGRTLGAIYHGLNAPSEGKVTPGAIMAWALDGSDLVGVVLRNGYSSITSSLPTKCNVLAGSDSDEHSVSYAVRIPSGLPAVLAAGTSGLLLQEARQYNTPLIGQLVTSPQQGTYPASFSLASVAGVQGAMLTAAKTGTADPDQLILRIYQPTNQPQTVQLKLAEALKGASARRVTALETPLADGAAGSGASGTIDTEAIPAPRAITTVALGAKSPG